MSDRDEWRSAIDYDDYDDDRPSAAELAEDDYVSNFYAEKRSCPRGFGPPFRGEGEPDDVIYVPDEAPDEVIYDSDLERGEE